MFSNTFAYSCLLIDTKYLGVSKLYTKFNIAAWNKETIKQNPNCHLQYLSGSYNMLCKIKFKTKAHSYPIVSTN